MECAKLRGLLSEYMDQTLDARSRALVREHISICRGCRQELASLGALVHQLRSIEPVEPPPGFLEELHERMASPSFFSRLKDLFFSPIRVKIPLELAGAAVMAVLVFFIFQIQQSEEEPLVMPETPAGIQTAEKRRAEKDLMDRAVQGASDKEPFDADEGLSRPERKGQVIELTLLNKSEKPVQEPVPSSSAAPESRPRAVGRPQEVAGDQVKEMKQREKRPVEEGGSVALEEKEPRGFLMSSDRVADLVDLVKGKILSVDYDPETGRPRVLDAEIPSTQYPRFLVELDRIGRMVPSSPEKPSNVRGESVRIRIHFQ